jgi:hypothetical protein
MPLVAGARGNAQAPGIKSFDLDLRPVADNNVIVCYFLCL